MNDLPLIVGAGPVGLAAALFLSEQGIPVRLIEAAEVDASHSRALAVNPRTLALLQSSGVADQMRSIGLPIRGGTLWADDQPIVQNDFTGATMLALSQAESIRLLRDAFEKLGGRVERGTKLTRIEQSAAGVTARLSREKRPDETITAPWVLAADGAHSVVRHDLKIGMPGTSFDRRWNLLDVELDIDLPTERAHVVLLPDGFLFMLRVVDQTSGRDGRLWRIMGNVEDLATRLPHGGKLAGPPAWTSSFHIVHRIVDRFSVGAVHLAGDAAHLHSPVGARGMNLGIEDAWVFARLAATQQLDRYHALRYPVDRAVVRRIEKISRMARGESAVARLARRSLAPVGAKIPFVRAGLVRTLTGTDHPLPFDLSSAV